MLPGLRRLAIVGNANAGGAVLKMGEVQAATHAVGLEVATLKISRPQDIAPAFEAIKGKVEALYICGDPLMATNRFRINTFALTARLPTIRNFSDYVEIGGLMSYYYGASFPDLYRRAADFVDQILRGATRRWSGISIL